MRPGFLLALLGLAAVTLVALLFIPRRDRATSRTEPAALPAPAAERAQGESMAVVRPELPRLPASGDPPTKAKTSRAETMDAEAREAQREAVVAARIAELRELSSKTDPASLATLLSAVRNPDPEIRQATLEFISESGNRAAIPGLLEVAAQTENETEKQAIDEVIEFLKLPTLTELLGREKK